MDSTTQKIRLTIPVSPEVHEAFTRMSKATGQSLGRCMGDWLGETLDGVVFITAKIEQAKSAPSSVIKELNLYAERLGEAAELADAWKSDRLAAAKTASPPSSNTGGKVPQSKPKGRK